MRLLNPSTGSRSVDPCHTSCCAVDVIGVRRWMKSKRRTSRRVHTDVCVCDLVANYRFLSSSTVFYLCIRLVKWSKENSFSSFVYLTRSFENHLPHCSRGRGRRLFFCRLRSSFDTCSDRGSDCVARDSNVYREMN